jgi:hypothetical protein
MCDARRRDAMVYEIVDANFHHLNRWKAKFGPEVQSYHSMRRTSRSIGTVAGIYRRI